MCLLLSPSLLCLCSLAQKTPSSSGFFNVKSCSLLKSFLDSTESKGLPLWALERQRVCAKLKASGALVSTWSKHLELGVHWENL